MPRIAHCVQAIDVASSSTRHEELLFDRKQLQMVWKLRRVLSGLDSHQAIDLLIDRLGWRHALLVLAALQSEALHVMRAAGITPARLAPLPPAALPPGSQPRMDPDEIGRAHV